MSRFAACFGSACLLLSLLTSRVCALSQADFDRVVDFSVTLKTLAAAASGETTAPNRYYVLDGTVTDIAILDKEQASFRVRIELLSGQWLGLDALESYGCYVTFSGPEFFSVFPARPTKTSNTVLPNSRVLVVARPLGTTTSPRGEKRMALEGLYVRVLQ